MLMPLLPLIETPLPAQGPISEFCIVMFFEFTIRTQSPWVEVILRPWITTPLFPLITIGPDSDNDEALEPFELEWDLANKAPSGPRVMVRKAQTIRSELGNDLLIPHLSIIETAVRSSVNPSPSWGSF